MATAWMRSRVEGQRVYCREVDQDRYGRSVSVCRLGGEDIGRSIVEAGWAIAYRRYSTAYVPEEARARVARRGIWAMGFEPPADYRRDRKAALPAQQPPTPRCAIKGNINRAGVHIFHVPGTRTYAEVRIDPARGERWFCSPREAEAAGWRAAR